MNEEQSCELKETTPPVSDKKSFMFLGISILVISIIFLIIFFGMKYINPYQPEQITYNYFDFVKKDTHWMTEWQGKDGLYELGFRFNPLEAEEVQVSGSLNESFNDRNVVYITFDPLEKVQHKYTALGAGELLLVAKRALHKDIEMACTQQDDNACVGFPIITCDSDASVIFLKPTAPTKVELNNSCITVQGEEMNLLKAIDRLLYQWLKIMQ